MGDTWDVSSDDVLAIVFLVFTPGKYMSSKMEGKIGTLLVRGTFENLGGYKRGTGKTARLQYCKACKRKQWLNG